VSTAFDPSRWAALSDALDALLELEPPARDARLAAIRAESPAQADELAALLAKLPELDAHGFLEEGALPPPPGSEGRVVGAYTLERELGRGGMGEVWLARRTDGRYEGRVAIKFLQAGLFGSGDAGRFAREGSILARLSHPHIARLLDAGVGPEGRPYLVLEYIDGVAIDRWCTDHALGTAERVALLLDVLAAVAHAHTRLILHRDLKPSNILVDAAGQVKLLDFGIAKLLDDSSAGGDGPGAATELTQRAGHAFTPLYAAPEQVQGGDVTTATDVYALGVLAYRLLADAHPVADVATGATLERLRAVVETVPRRLSETVARSGTPGAARRARELRGDLDTIVAQALKKAPGERYANAAAMAEDLRRWLAHEPIAARPDGAAYRVAKFVRRHRAGVAAGTVAAVALATGVGVALVQAREARQQRAQAEGLVEYMVGDLRKKLEPVGRLDALDGVGTRALAYYAAQDPASLDADSLGRRARALHLIGEIAEQRGRMDEAASMFREAAESTGELLARHPRDGQRIYDHAQSEFYVGNIARELGRPAEAEAGFGAYLALAERLVAIDPSNSDWRLEKYYAVTNLALLRLEAGRPAEALRRYDLALGLIGAELEKRPELANDMANLLGWRARAQEELGDYRASIASSQAKLRVIAQSPAAATDRNLQFLHADALHEIGRMHLFLGEYEAGEPIEHDGVERLRALVALDATNLEWQSELAVAEVGLADLRLARGDAAGAREALEQAEALTQRLMAADARKPYWNVLLLGRALAVRAALEPTDAHAVTARLRAYAEALPRFEQPGHALDPEHRRVVASVLLALGDREAASHEADALDRARRAWRQAAAHTDAETTRGLPPSMAMQARALQRLGEIDAARGLAARLEVSAYRGPGYADLKLRLAAADPIARAGSAARAQAGALPVR
jgi:serine/threonine-protein kinase